MIRARGRESGTDRRARHDSIGPLERAEQELVEIRSVMSGVRHFETATAYGSPPTGTVAITLAAATSTTKTELLRPQAT